MRFFNTPSFNAPVTGSRRNIAITFGVEKLEWRGYRIVKKFVDMFSRFDILPARDGQTDIL